VAPDLRDRSSILIYDWLWEDVLTVSLLACPDAATCLAKLEQVRAGDFTGTGGRLAEDFCRSHSPDSLFSTPLSARCPHPYLEDHILRRTEGGFALEALKRFLPVEICSTADVEILDSYHEITCALYWRIDAALQQPIAPADPLPRFP